MMAEANFEDFMMDDAADGNGNDDDEDGGGGVGICVDVDGSGIPAVLKATYLGPAGDDEDDEGGTNSASSSRRQQQQQQQQQHGKQGHGLQTQPSVCGGGGGGGGAGGSIVVGEGSSRKEFRRCVICQDVTERRHLNYGADACFSCRAFFRRTHQKRQPPSFECKGSGDCEVTARTRRRCQSCRYDRCLRAGMRPEFVMGEEQRMARMEKCRRKRQDREQRSGGMRSGGGSGGGSGGAAGGRNVVNGDGEKRDAKRGRKRPKKVEVKEELMGEEEESYLLQLAEVAARQVGLDDEEEDIKPVGNEGSEMIRVKKEEGEEDEDEEEEEAKPPPLFAPSSNPFTLQYRQRWHSSAGDLAFLRDRRGYNSQDVLGDVDAMATGNSSSGGSSNTTLQLRQQHAPMPPQRFFSLDHDHRPSSSSLASSFHDVQSSSSESWDQWRGYFSSQQQQQQHGHYGQQQQQQQQHQMMPPRHHQHHQHQQQHQIGQGSGDVPSAINTEQELNDIASVLSSQQNIEQQQQQQQQFHHQQHQQQGEQDDQDSLLLLSSTPSELESNVSLLTAELEVAQRLAVKKNPGESSNKSVLASSSCHSFSSSSSSASFSASASASASASVSVSASASGCPICREHGPSRRRVLSGWHATVSSFLSPDPDFLQAIIRTHQGGPPVAHAQMWRHLERLRRLFTEFFVSFSSSSGGDSGGPGGDSSDKETSPSSSEKGASLLVDYLLARYAGSPRSAGAGCQLQWLLLCQLPEYVTEVLGLRWLPANGLSGPVRVVSEPPPLPFSGLPLMAYLVLSDPESPGDGPAGAMAAGLRESSSSSSRCCDECKDSGIILETLDFLLVSRFGQQPASSSSSSSSCSSHNKEEEEFVQKKLQRFRVIFRREVPFDDEILKDFVMYTLDVPISRSFAARGVSNLVERFCAIAADHDGLAGIVDPETEEENEDDEDQGGHRARLLEGTAVFRCIGLTLAHCYALPDGASQLRFSLGQAQDDRDEAKEGWRKYESMVGGRRLKKVALKDINDKSRVLEPKQMDSYNTLMERLHPLVADEDTYRLVTLASLFRQPERDFLPSARGAAARALRQYLGALRRRPAPARTRAGAACASLAEAAEEAAPAVEELARLVRRMVTLNNRQTGKAAATTLA